MKELVSPEQSETLIFIVTVLLTLGAAAFGYKTFGRKGVMWALLGPLLYGLWRFHSWITRYDPQTGYFGLDKVKVLLLEVVLFVVLGAVLGTLWNKMAPRENETPTT